MKLPKLISSDSVLNYFNAGLSAVAGILFVPLYISWVGSDAYGEYAKVILALSAFFIFDLGFSSITLRLYGQNQKHRSRLVSFIVIITVFYSLFLLTITNFLDWFRLFDLVFPASWAWVLPLYFLSKAFDEILRSILLGARKIQHYAIVGIIHTVSRYVVLTIWFYFDFFTLPSVVLLLCLAHLIAALFTLLFMDCNVDWYHPLGLSKHELHYMFGSFLTGVLSFAFLQIDKVFAARSWSHQDFSIYSVASGVAGFLFIAALPLSQRFNTVLLRRLKADGECFSWRVIRNFYFKCVFQLVSLLATIAPFYMWMVFEETPQENILFLFGLILSNALNVASWLQIFIFHCRNRLLIANIMQVFMLFIYVVSYGLFDIYSYWSAPILALIVMQAFGFLVLIPVVLKLYFRIDTWRENGIFFMLCISYIYLVFSISYYPWILFLFMLLIVFVSIFRSPLMRFIGVKSYGA